MFPVSSWITSTPEVPAPNASKNQYFPHISSPDKIAVGGQDIVWVELTSSSSFPNEVVPATGDIIGTSKNPISGWTAPYTIASGNMHTHPSIHVSKEEVAYVSKHPVSGFPHELNWQTF